MAWPDGRWRWPLVALLLLLGVVIGLAGAFVQAHRAVLELPWGVVALPWGVPIVWVTLVAAIRGGAWLVLSRWGAWSVLVGWLGATVAMAAETPSGDLALSGGARQMTYLLGGVIIASAAASLPVPSRYRRESRGNAPVS